MTKMAVAASVTGVLATRSAWNNQLSVSTTSVSVIETTACTRENAVSSLIGQRELFCMVEPGLCQIPARKMILILPFLYFFIVFSSNFLQIYKYI